MGVRAVHAVVNDLFFHRAEDWQLDEWIFGADDKTSTTAEDIEEAVASVQESHVYEYLTHTARAMSTFDWRSLDGPGVRSSEDEMTKRAYRGSGGYTLLTGNVLRHVSEHGDATVAEVATEILPPPVDP